MKKIGLFLTSTLILLSALSLNNAVSIKESCVDDFNETKSFNIKNLQVGENENMNVSPTFVQVGRKTSTNNFVLRFATAITGPVSHATYKRVADGFEDNTKDVTTVYKGISAGNTTYYYDGNNLVTEATDATKNYYWACYVVEYVTNDYVDTDFNVSLTIDDAKGNTLTSENKITSLNTRLENEEGIYKLTLKGMTFEDGTSSKYFFEGDSIEGLFDIPSVDGYSYKGICEVGTVSNIVSYNTMPAKNITLAPAYDREFIGDINVNNPGKINVGDYHSSANRPGFDKAKMGIGYNSAIYNEKVGVYELLRNYTHTEGFAADSYFVTMYKHSGTTLSATPITYTIQNQGETELQIKLINTGSSGSPENSSTYPNDTITLAPGAIDKVSFTSKVHDSFLTCFKFLNESTTPLNIGVMCETTMSTVTLKEGTFKDGSTSKEFVIGGDFASELKEVEGYSLRGYFTDNEYVYTSNTKAPNESVVVKPFYEVSSYLVELPAVDDNGNPLTGKIDLLSLHPSAGYNGFTNAELSQNRVTSIYMEDLGIYEQARNFSKAGGVSEGNSFISFVQHAITNGYVVTAQAKVTYTFQNKGTETIKFTVNQAKDSGNPQSDSTCMANLITVELAPGEIKNIDITLVRHNSLMLYFKMLTSTTSNFSLATILKYNG